jgi:hypothetical protein
VPEYSRAEFSEQGTYDGKTVTVFKEDGTT